MQASACPPIPCQDADEAASAEQNTSTTIDYTLGLYQSIGEALHTRPIMEKSVLSTMSDGRIQDTESSPPTWLVMRTYSLWIARDPSRRPSSG